MKAVIIAGGYGKRLYPLTQELPKPLLSIHGKEILSRMLDSLTAHNITTVVFLVSYLAEKIEDFVAQRYSSLSVTYKYDPVDETTNYIYALALAKKELLDDDILLMHADLVFQPDLLSRLLSVPYSGVLVQKEGAVPSKDFKARIQNGLVTEIGISVGGSHARFCVPFYKLRKEDFVLWMREIERFIAEDKKKSYAEDAFNAMSPQFPLHPVYFEENELCMEIDDFDDLQRAMKLLKGK